MNTHKDLQIEREHTAAGGRWFVRLPGGDEAQMTYRSVAPDQIVIGHTGVPSAYRGSGLAQKLVEAGIAAARAEGFTIVPHCSYVAAQFARHPEWSDLLAKE